MYVDYTHAHVASYTLCNTWLHISYDNNARTHNVDISMHLPNFSCRYLTTSLHLCPLHSSNLAKSSGVLPFCTHKQEQQMWVMTCTHVVMCSMCAGCILFNPLNTSVAFYTILREPWMSDSYNICVWSVLVCFNIQGVYIYMVIINHIHC